MTDVSRGVERGTRVELRLGEAIRERRLAAAISEVRLAAAVGAPVPEVRLWERGHRVPDAATIRALIRVLSVDSAVADEWLEAAGVSPVVADRPEVSILLLSGDAPADPFGDAPADLGAPVRPAPPRAIPARRPASPVAAVFPEPGEAALVYSDAAAQPWRRRTSWGRRLMMVAAMITFGLVLWWAFGELGQGLSSLMDRLGGPAGVLATT